MAAAPLPDFVAHCVELLASLGSVRTRRMFGGWGLYVDDLFIALIAFERLYLKADEASRERFAAAGCEPFVHDAAGKSVSLGYWTAPAEALDSPALMLPWARAAMQAALAAKAARVKPPRPPGPAMKGARKAATKAPRDRRG
jgi:DNA transformation protein